MSNKCLYCNDKIKTKHNDSIWHCKCNYIVILFGITYYDTKIESRQEICLFGINDNYCISYHFKRKIWNINFNHEENFEFKSKLFTLKKAWTMPKEEFFNVTEIKNFTITRLLK